MKKTLLILFLTLLPGIFAQAEKAPASKSKAKTKGKPSVIQPGPPGFFERTYIKANKGVSSAATAVGGQVDIFLSGQKYTRKKNKSSVTLKNAASYVEGESSIDTTTRFDVRLHLPHLESKWALRFTSYDEDEDERGINRNRPKAAPRRENYGTSIAILQKLGDIDVTFRPRVRIKNGLETSHLLKLESVAEVKKYKVRPRLELFARSDVGTGELFGIETGYEINNFWSIIMLNEQEYVNLENKLSTNHELSLNQAIEENKLIKYAVLFESNNKPSFHLFEYVFYISYSHAVLKDMLHYNITPRLFFNEENSFRPKNGLVVSLDFIF